MSVKVNIKKLEKKINDIHERHELSKNNLKHEVFANIIN